MQQGQRHASHAKQEQRHRKQPYIAKDLATHFNTLVGQIHRPYTLLSLNRTSKKAITQVSSSAPKPQVPVLQSQSCQHLAPLQTQQHDRISTLVRSSQTRAPPQSQVSLRGSCVQLLYTMLDQYLEPRIRNLCRWREVLQFWCFLQQ